jgi:hypothetical protein
MTESSDNTRSAGAQPSTGEEPGVRGGSADRLDSPGSGSGGLPGGGADGETAAREDLRTSLGERAATAGREDGDSLEQAAAIGETDDPQGGSIQEDGSRS